VGAGEPEGLRRAAGAARLTAADACDSASLLSGTGGPSSVAAAHVVRRAQARPGWAIVTDRAAALLALDPAAEVDELP
jgi:hypothetical protein